MSKFWDGYDNQPIAWIDDPICSSANRTGDEEPVQRLKNIMSMGELIVEVKHGSIVFDSSFIIISCNQDPQYMADSCSPDNREAMYRRFTDTCGAHHIDTKRTARERLPVHLCKMIKKNIDYNFGTNLDVNVIIRTMPEFETITYEDVPQLADCNVAEYQ